MSAPPKNAGKAPSMQWYPADWRQDNGVQALSYHDRGVWFEMLNIMHASSERGVLAINGSAMTREMIARLLGLDNQSFNQTLTTLLTLGVARERDGDKAIFSKRMVHDEKLTEIRREAGKLGGNPSLLNQNPTTPVKQIPTPSSSSSSSSSTSSSLSTPIPTPKRERRIFTPPTLEEWTAYGLSLSPPFPQDEIDQTFDHYTGNGWRAGKNPMIDWKASLRTCWRNWKKNPRPQFAATPGQRPKNIYQGETVK